MTFRPINPRNAVLEAVVLLHFNRPVFAPEIDAVRAQHPLMAQELPRLDELQVVNIAVGPALPSILPGTPVAMAAFKRDGSLETRLLLRQQLLAVNFLFYTRWDDLWPKAANWFRITISALQGSGPPAGLPPLQVAMIGHQMINVFLWEGTPYDADIKKLFAQKPSRLADAAWQTSGQPWFATHSTNQPKSLGGRSVAFVDSLSFDLSDEPSIGWRLRLEQTLEARFTTALDTGEVVDENTPGQRPLIDAAMDQLHEHSRNLMRSLLDQKMLNQIGMA